MKFDGFCGLKIVSTVGSIACYGLLYGFWSSLEAKYYRFVLATIFTGYAVLYISLTLAVMLGEEVDRTVNRVFAMYGVGAYLGAATNCTVHAGSEITGEEKIYCLAAVGVSVAVAVTLTVEAVTLLNDPVPSQGTSTAQIR